MSAGQHSYLIRERMSPISPALRYVVWDRLNGQIVDAFGRRESADHALTLLRSGRASVNPHAVLGCRVEVII